MRNPFLLKRWTLILYIISWFAAFCIQSFITVKYFQLSIFDALIDNFAFNLISAFAGLSLWFIIRFNNVNNISIDRIIVNLLATALVVISFINLISFLIFFSIHSFNFNETTFYQNHLILKLLLSIVYYVVLVIIYYFQVLYLDYREQQMREIRLQSMVKDAEIKALKARINPHFLFNSLNSASSLTITNPAKAQEMIIKLSDYFRFSLTKNNVSEVHILDEIENAMLYLEIEKIRFEDKLSVHKNISIHSQEATIPALLLQPLFENAVKHGVYESSENSTIEFTCIEESGLMTIRLKNNFSLSFTKTGTGTGLKIVQERLNLHYGDSYFMETRKDENSFEVEIRLPLKSKTKG